MTRLEFGVLGPVELHHNGRPIHLGSAKQQALLGAGLLHANAVVSSGRLVDAIWGERPPPTATALVQTYVSRLRRLIGPAGPTTLLTRPPGYVLQVAPDGADISRFERLVSKASEAVKGADNRHAARLLRQALGQWRGPALDGLETPLFRAAANRLEEMRLSAIEQRIDAEAHTAPSDGVVAELTELVAAHPLRERLRSQLMRTLYQLGRQTEALEIYRQTYITFREELGIEPSRALQQLHRAILNADPSLRSGGGTVVLKHPASQPATTPRQLPAPPSCFVGRSDECGTLSVAIRSAVDAGRPVLAVLSGPAGSGKTALALTIAQAAQDAFPDGQLFVRLHGAADHGATGAIDALAMMLRSIDPQRAVTARSIDEGSAMLRTATAGRRILFILDDVPSAAAVRPLLALQPGCAVLITSRPSLADLDHQVRVDLDPLTHAQAIALLSRLLGEERIRAEPIPANDIASWCDGLPLALRAAAARLAARPRWPLAAFARRLEQEHRRLDELSAGDLDVRASLAASYRTIGPVERTAFRLLGRLQQPKCCADLLAGLLELPVARAEQVADRLVEARLLDRLDSPADDRNWYLLPSLPRLFAREQPE